MPTGTAGNTAYHASDMRINSSFRRVTIADVASTGPQLHLAKLPAGAIYLRAISGIYINVAFDGTTTLNVGTIASASLIGSAMATTALGFLALDETTAVPQFANTTDIYLQLNGTTPTVGDANVCLFWIEGAQPAEPWA